MRTMALPLDGAALRHVVHNMREWDRKEIFATRNAYDPDDFAAFIEMVPGPKWIAWAGDEPVASIGCCPFWPGVWSPWCFGTDRFPEASLLLTRLGKRVIIPGVREAGGRRLEVKSIEGHEDAQAWLTRCFGCHLEATHPKYGRDGETFHTFVLMV
jgi:hypothetical protein